MKRGEAPEIQWERLSETARDALVTMAELFLAREVFTAQIDSHDGGVRNFLVTAPPARFKKRLTKEVRKG